MFSVGLHIDDMQLDRVYLKTIIHTSWLTNAAAHKTSPTIEQFLNNLSIKLRSALNNSRVHSVNWTQSIIYSESGVPFQASSDTFNCKSADKWRWWAKVSRLWEISKPGTDLRHAYRCGLFGARKRFGDWQIIRHLCCARPFTFVSGSTMAVPTRLDAQHDKYLNQLDEIENYT